ncbi:hypothetical protein RISK_004464 [Rhodopirellula islandica]|uniref:Uncharacterized protein n=1 Tax=Rhodopirellula islandica TaxID=595434 RepID=A0A0J1BA29_RHOIS|nr:hypothetical protein RISK_004464 [Rhodopirellula islandica]
MDMPPTPPLTIPPWPLATAGWRVFLRLVSLGYAATQQPPATIWHPYRDEEGLTSEQNRRPQEAANAEDRAAQANAETAL